MPIRREERKKGLRKKKRKKMDIQHLQDLQRQKKWTSNIYKTFNNLTHRGQTDRI